LKHVCWADSNTGDCGLMPVPSRLNPPPPALGSGKFGTPRERMHSETFSFALERDDPTDAAPAEWPDEPQAAIAIAHVMAANVITVQPFSLAIASVVANHR